MSCSPTQQTTKQFVTQFINRLGNVGIELMSTGERAATAMVEIRVKSTTDAPIDIDAVYAATVNAAADHSITNVRKVELSPHSSKFTSVQFEQGNRTHDVVLAQGGNRGHLFEGFVLEKLRAWERGLDDGYCARMFESIATACPGFDPVNIESVHHTSTSAPRPVLESSIGQHIADFQFNMTDGSHTYVSLKHKTGKTLANLGGAAELIREDLTVNTDAQLFPIFNQIGADITAIAAGYRAYETGVETDGQCSTESVSIPVSEGTPLYDLVSRAWGSGYVYLRESPNQPGGWSAINVTADTVRDVLLDELQVVKLQYPSKTSKSIVITLNSIEYVYRIEIRNSKRGIRPTDVKVHAVPRSA